MTDDWFGTPPTLISETGAAVALSKLMHPDGRWILLAKTRQHLTTRELMATLDTIIADPDLGPQAPALWDFTDTDFSTHSAQSCLSCAMTLMRVPDRQGAKRALVVTDELGYGVARLFQQFLEGLNVDDMANFQMFKTVDAAMAWLSGAGRLLERPL